MYAGYVDDPRNTDNAWMETVVFNFHDDTGSTLLHNTHKLAPIVQTKRLLACLASVVIACLKQPIFSKHCSKISVTVDRFYLNVLILHA